MIFQKILSFLYPHVCPFCGKVTKEEVCNNCKRQLHYITEPRCKCCGKPLRYQEYEYCYDCMRQKHWFDEGRSLWLHKKPVSTSLYQFKYHNKRIYSKFYAAQLERHYAKLIHSWGIQLIIPIPLHKKRYRKRGYNQAELIAAELGESLHIPIATKAIRRVRETNPQKKLDDKLRKKNLKHAFCAYGEFGKIKSVLLIDDIYTTGSTIDTVAELLKSRGVQKVYFLTISIGQGF